MKEKIQMNALLIAGIVVFVIVGLRRPEPRRSPRHHYDNR